eukprot:3444056-Lingulodinium_polyedra.AAC.1
MPGRRPSHLVFYRSKYVYYAQTFMLMIAKHRPAPRAAIVNIASSAPALLASQSWARARALAR